MNQTLIIKPLLATAVLTSLMFPVDHCRAQKQLFHEPPTVGLAVSRPTHAVNLEYVSVDLEMLAAVQPQDQLAVQLPDEKFVATVKKVKPQVDGYSVRGSLDDIPGSFFTVSVVDDLAAGTFFIPGRRLVRLRYGAAGGLHYLHEVVAGPNDQCAGGDVVRRNPGNFPIPDLAELQNRLTQPRDLPGGPPQESGGCGPTDPTFDILMVYSDDARSDAGGTSAIRAECINAVEVTELTYETCFITIRTNIVWLSEVTYNEAGRSYEQHLDGLTATNDGILDQVHTLRDIADADFVALVVEDEESGGLGWCLAADTHAMTVCRWDLLTDVFVLAHEIGHNIGCAHNPEDADCMPTEIGFGHNFFVPADGVWRHTVMAYSRNGSSVIPYYSSPACQYQNVPTGTANRDNLAVILARQSVCEDFRLTRMDVWVDFNFPGAENGSFDNPFDTVIEGVNRILPTPIADIPVLHIKAGSRNEALTIDKSMIIEACGGTVTIGG